MYDVITFGSATRDAFFYSRNFKILEGKKFPSSKALCFDLGSKIEVDKIFFTTGGGGTNTAVAFSKLGLKVACIASVGNDVSGQAVLFDLQKEKVDTKFIIKTNKENTAYAVILSVPRKERTILVYRGASEEIKSQDVYWPVIKSKWFYIASLGGDFPLLKKIFQHAKKNKIKIAINPGTKELNQPKKIWPLLKKADILFLNQEEAVFLTRISFGRPRAILKKLDDEIFGVVVMTSGKSGSKAAFRGSIYEAGIIPVRVVERTGAGDAFGAGFVSGMILKNDIAYAIKLATANSTSVIQKVGAKNGLLSKKDLKKFKKVEVRLSKN
jgi:ribokinase